MKTEAEIREMADKEFEGKSVDSGYPPLDSWILEYAKALWCLGYAVREAMENGNESI